MMEAIRSSGTSVLTRVALHSIPVDDILHSHRRGNLKSCQSMPRYKKLTRTFWLLVYIWRQKATAHLMSLVCYGGSCILCGVSSSTFHLYLFYFGFGSGTSQGCSTLLCIQSNHFPPVFFSILKLV
jgi:hypothetical protein